MVTGLFNVITAGRTYALAAANVEIMQEWVDILGRLKTELRDQSRRDSFLAGATNESTVAHSQQSPQLQEGAGASGEYAITTPVNPAKQRLQAEPYVALGSPSTRRKHRRNSSLDSPQSAEKNAGSRGPAADFAPSPVTPLPSSLADLKRQSLGGSPAKRVGSGTLSAQKLVTPPPFQLKKMMDSAKNSPSPVIGVKSHSSVAAIPGMSSGSSSAPPGLQEVPRDPRDEMRRSAPEMVYSTAGDGGGVPGALEEARFATRVAETTLENNGGLVAAVEASIRPSGAYSAPAADEGSGGGGRFLHPMGVPTQGVVRLPKGKLKKDDEGEGTGTPSSEYGGAVKRSARQPGLSISDLEQRLLLDSPGPVEELTPISEVQREQQQQQQQQQRQAQNGLGVPATASFEGLAERVENLMAKSATVQQQPPSAPPFSSAKSHASRFHEDLMSQMRTEQFELLKAIKDMQDEQEIQELRLQQLHQRVKNAEELVDEKSKECQLLRDALSGMRKENASLRNKVDDFQRLQRAAALEEERDEATRRRVTPPTTGDHSDGSSDEQPQQPSPIKIFDLSDEEPAPSSSTQGPNGRRLSRRLDPVEFERERVLRLQLETRMEAMELKHISELSMERKRFIDASKAHASEKSKLLQQLAEAVDALDAFRRPLGKSVRPGFGGPAEVPDELRIREFIVLQEELRGEHAKWVASEEENKRLRERVAILEARLGSVEDHSVGVMQRQRSGSIPTNTAGILTAVPTSSTSVASPRGSPREEPPLFQEVIQRLWRELEALKMERLVTLGVRDQINSRLMDMLTRQRHDRDEFRMRVLFAQGRESGAWEDLKVDLDRLEHELFHSVAFALKLEVTAATGEPCNVDIPRLWVAAKDAHVHWSLFREWIHERIG